MFYKLRKIFIKVIFAKEINGMKECLINSAESFTGTKMKEDLKEKIMKDLKKCSICKMRSLRV